MKKSAYKFLLMNKEENLFLRNIFDYLRHEKPLNLDRLAQESFISKSGISRYFKNHGFDGFKEFKYLLLNESLELNDFSNSENFEAEVMFKPIQKTSCLNSIDKFEEALKLISQARIINIIGIGGNHTPAYELTTRLKKFGFNVFHHFEFKDTFLSLANANDQDLAIFFSYTGETQAILKAIQVVKENHQKIIAVTRNEESILTQAADLNFLIDDSDNLLRIMPLKSRVSMLYIVFKLANYIYQSDKEKYFEFFLHKVYD